MRCWPLRVRRFGGSAERGCVKNVRIEPSFVCSGLWRGELAADGCIRPQPSSIPRLSCAARSPFLCSTGRWRGGAAAEAAMATGLRACRPGGGRVFELCRQRRPCAADLPVVVGQTALGEAAGRTEMFRRLTTAAGLAVRSAVCMMCCGNGSRWICNERVLTKSGQIWLW